uniref:Ig-like domain-containing protein n=1 Tax=Oreochromis niloticus TaxID=8128 RepID=A0A669AYG1_ORENI
MCRMMNVITALALSCFCWIAVSGSEFQTSEVQAGENVTLQCNKIYTYDVQTFWFRLVNGTTVNSIAFMQAYSSNVNYNDGFKNGKFEMTQNTSDVFLKIKQVDVSDSGLYFCGFVSEGRLNVTVMQLKVGGTDEPEDDMDCISKQAHEVAKLTSVTLGVLSVFLLMVISGLVVQNMKLQTANKEEKNPDHSTNNGSDEVNYAAVTVRPKPKRREIETNVIYASTR